MLADESWFASMNVLGRGFLDYCFDGFNSTSDGRINLEAQKSDVISIDDLSKKFLSLDMEEDSFSALLMGEAEKIMKEDLSDAHNAETPLGREPSQTLNVSDMDRFDAFVPAYIKLAHRWLVAHLHNPYPSNAFKASLAKESDVSLKCINVWFANARRRIGWTAISKRYFSGNRPDTVDYAHRCFKRKESDLSLNESIRSDFLAMRVKAESLYQGKFETDMSAYQLQRAAGEIHVKGNSSTSRKRKRTEEPLNVDIPASAGCLSRSHSKKRHANNMRNRDSEFLYSSDESDDVRPPRFYTIGSSSTQSLSSRSSTPLPATPTHEYSPDFSFEPWQSENECDSDNFDEGHSLVGSAIPCTRTRKRRLSQSDKAPLKRPRGTPLPRLHAVSDSYLLDHDDARTLSILSQLDFTLPEPVSLNDSLPPVFETSLFQDWAKLSEPISPVTISQSHSSRSIPCQNNSISKFAVNAAEPSDFVDLDNLFEEVIAIPALPGPHLLDNTESLSFCLTSDDGKLDSSLSPLDLPLCSSFETDLHPAQQPQFDLISMLILPDPQTLESQAGIDNLPETHSDASTTARNKSVADADAFKVLQKQVDLEETTPGTKADDGISGSSDQSREGKLQKLHLLLAEAEKLKQELSC